jgi:hypothetical protein
MNRREIDNRFLKDTPWIGGLDAVGKPQGNGFLVWPEEDSREYSAGTMVAGSMQDCWIIKYRGISVWRKVHMKNDVQEEKPQVILHPFFTTHNILY